MENYWFIYGDYSYAGAPKMEKYMFDLAWSAYKRRLIKDEDLPKLVAKLNHIQDIAWEDNKRLKKVNIELSRTFLGLEDDVRSLYIGNHCIKLMKVAGELVFEEA